MIYLDSKGHILWGEVKRDVGCGAKKFRGIQLVFPFLRILAGKIHMAMPGPSALHWPQPKIKDI